MTTMLGLATFRMRFTCNNQQCKKKLTFRPTNLRHNLSLLGVKRLTDLWVRAGDVLQDQFGLLEVFTGCHVEVS